MCMRFKEKMILNNRYVILNIILLISGILLYQAGFVKAAENYYSIGYTGGTWDVYHIIPTFYNSNPVHPAFFNPGYRQNYTILGNYHVSPSRDNLGLNFNLNPIYSPSNRYSGLLSGYQPGFGLNNGLYGRTGIFQNPYFPGLANQYNNFYPGRYSWPLFPSYGGYDRPVSSDDPVSSQNPLDPQPGDQDLIQGPVYLTETQIYVLESYPMQVMLEIKGNLPTPCHQLRAEVSEPDHQNRIQIEIYSLVDPDIVCIQVLEPFEERLSLGSYTDGAYTVWINGEKVEEFSF